MPCPARTHPPGEAPRLVAARCAAWPDGRPSHAWRIPACPFQFYRWDGTTSTTGVDRPPGTAPWTSLDGRVKRLGVRGVERRSGATCYASSGVRGGEYRLAGGRPAMADGCPPRGMCEAGRCHVRRPEIGQRRLLASVDTIALVTIAKEPADLTCIGDRNIGRHETHDGGDPSTQCSRRADHVALSVVSA